MKGLRLTVHFLLMVILYELSMNYSVTGPVGRRKKDRAVLMQWARSQLLANTSDWKNNTMDTFHTYMQKLSKVYCDHNASMSFFLIGACDGSYDATMSYYLMNSHWRGVFVEPDSVNFKDLTNFLVNKNVSHRSLVMQAAATIGRLLTG